MSKVLGMFLAIAILLPAGVSAAKQAAHVGVHNGTNQVTVNHHTFIIRVANHHVTSVQQKTAHGFVNVRGTSSRHHGFTVYNSDCSADVYGDWYPYPYLYSFWWC